MVEEHGLDLDDLVVLFLLHLNVGVDLFEAVLHSLEGFGQGDGPALLKSIGHLLEHHRVSVDVRHREVPAGIGFDVLGHGRFGPVGTLHDGVMVVVGRRHHVVAGEEEDGRKAEQRKVDTVVSGVVDDALDAIGRRHHAEQTDDERHIFIHRLALQLGALAALGSAELFGKLRFPGEVVRCALELAHALLCLFRELGQPPGGFLGLLADNFRLACGAQTRDVGLFFRQNFQQGIHIPLVLEVALLLLAAVVLHHEVSHRGKHPLAGEASLAHGHPLEHTADAAIGQIIPAVDVEAVEVEGLFAHAAGADLFAGFLIGFQRCFVQMGEAQLCRMKQHRESPSSISFPHSATLSRKKQEAVSDDLLLKPFSPDKTHHKADGAERPVEIHPHPDAEQSAAHLQDPQVAEAHAEHPHGHDADGHGEAGVAGGTEDVGQGEAGGPEEEGDDVEPHHDFQRHGRSLRREAEPGQRPAVGEEEGRQVHDPGTAVGHQQQAAGIPDSLLFLACTEALAHHREHRHADGAGRDVQEGAGGVGHGIGRDGGGAEGAGEAGHRQFADLEHPVLDARRDAHPQDAPDELSVRLQGRQAGDAEHTTRLLEQEEDGTAGHRAGDEAGQRRAHDAHLEAKDEDGIAADVDDIHHKAGHHADLAVALRPEEGRACVIQADERVAQGRQQEIRLGVLHHIGVDGAENAPQDGVAPHHDHRCHKNAEAGHDEHDLCGGSPGALLLPMADVLAGDHRAAGGQRCHDLYHQGVEGIHKAHARHRRLAHRRHHEGIGQADGHAQGLLRNERQQQGRQLSAGKQRLRFKFCARHSLLRAAPEGAFLKYTDLSL